MKTTIFYCRVPIHDKSVGASLGVFESIWVRECYVRERVRPWTCLLTAPPLHAHSESLYVWVGGLLLAFLRGTESIWSSQIVSIMITSVQISPSGCVYVNDR